MQEKHNLATYIVTPMPTIYVHAMRKLV